VKDDKCLSVDIHRKFRNYNSENSCNTKSAVLCEKRV